jgi:hypothetical protein
MNREEYIVVKSEEINVSRIKYHDISDNLINRSREIKINLGPIKSSIKITKN